MTEAKREFPPKKQVPTDQWIVVLFRKAPTEGKPFVKQTESGETKVERTNFTFQIADKNYPELCGQPHTLQTSAWISAGSQGKQSSGSFQTVACMIGSDRAAKFDRTDANRDLTIDDWKPMFGCYAAKFKEPSVDKQTNQVLLDEKGGIAYQGIKEITTLPSLRWKEEDVKLWPPPQKEETSNPTQSQTTPAPQPPKTEAPPATTPPQTQTNPASARTPGIPAIQQVVNEIKAFVTPVGPARALAMQFLSAKGKPKVTELIDTDVRLLHTLLQIEEQTHNGQEYLSEVQSHLTNWKTTLLELNPTSADLLLSRLNDMASDVPF